MYAVIPGIPRTPTAVETGAFAGSIRRMLPPALAVEWVCQPVNELTMSPGRNPSARDSRTSLTPPAGITPPSSTPGAYPAPASFMRLRM